jgi:ActR/RegA family two-component response regulator
MRRSAVLFCEDHSSLHTLKAVLQELDIDVVVCRGLSQAMEFAVAGQYAALIADFDLPGAASLVKVAALLAPPEKPVLLAINGAGLATGEAFQSGAHRILYKPLAAGQIKDAFDPGPRAKKIDQRKFPRCTMKALLYLDFERGTIPALGINLSESGFGVHATEPIPLCSKLAFRCLLPGTNHRLHGECEVIWSDREGRAGMFFSRLAPAARRHLKHWLDRQMRADKHRSKNKNKDSEKEKVTARALLPPMSEIRSPAPRH